MTHAQTPANPNSCRASDYRNVLLQSILTSQSQRPEETSSFSDESTISNSAAESSPECIIPDVSTSETAPRPVIEELTTEHTTEEPTPGSPETSLQQKPSELNSLDEHLQTTHGSPKPKKPSSIKPRQMPLAISDSECSDDEMCKFKARSKLFRSLAIDIYDGNRDESEHRQQEEDAGSDPENGPLTHKDKMKKWSRSAENKFERMLLDIIVDTDRIPPNYENMFIDKRTIRKLEDVTTLSLSRPKAFNHGVLRDNKVTGAVLYGPPGTGKTLLTRAMARQSGFNMLAASTAELWQKCHGEDEKVIKALFSMGRKMHPCIVFLDEADAMLGSRKAGEKRHIRSMINQFLMEWDGLSSGTNAPFILLATNRPFDLDPAVLRRAPVQILLDVPTMNERCGILGLLLKDEKLSGDINPQILAKLTDRFTGSDLKNLCVMAATDCVSQQIDDTADRVLTKKHFLTAMETIKPVGLGKTLVNEFKKFEKHGTLADTYDEN
ncbi:hypothetical protein Dda_8226 [Drechslerella dactyloides]|uniref:AAA+ ATPase domain-containing protein n=1 Tax=Drechslerella dactyloides TaxID=74499 RepID=A0AAD6IVU4_DREDA|nr:hypothetical protein Dda_8226 [Drechslerella dactyloides]